MQKQYPSFFKILIGDFASALRLPPLFVEIFGEKLSPTLSLVANAAAASEKKWAVKLKKSGEHSLFGDGWDKFVKDNDLAAGDFAVFWLMDNYSTFQVRLYDYTCCEKQLSSSRFSPAGGRSTNLDRNVRMKKGEETDESTKSVGTSKRSNNPSFVVALPPRDKKMIIPKGFVEKMGIVGEGCILLENARGRRWEIQIRNQGGEFAMYGGEWEDFRKANRLGKGYLCSFELVRRYGDQFLQFHLEKKARGRPEGKTTRDC
ncbi:unnamed protein product [Cuscuta epithymum]|uniref:TF-B3 domain-containing protein n=1 Tax=Cuscuta epithymum TaxID=186058 RepID=A0AAV0D115_9ASTE|nr:unnamed protein product [Cuscuta epithymum]